MGESLLERADANKINATWPFVAHLKSASDIVDASALLQGLGDLIGRRARVDILLQDAVKAIDLGGDDPDGWLLGSPSLGPTMRDVLELVAHRDDHGLDAEPVLTTKGVLRPAGRYWGSDVEKRNSRTDGRLAVARMIGSDVNSRDAHLALIEIAQGICRPKRPACGVCPLKEDCMEAVDIFACPSDVLF
ncbi:hypothetical protein [Serinicoccus sp. CNJ-927]|uniref:hypothetical protein n=1 Tax=Serinicoccus sp. CNJ-927 TaxID=1904970 RepID=UPI00192D0A05|nr:hypothetical protein [Serinicoccus sp. CNJ-927]